MAGDDKQSPWGNKSSKGSSNDNGDDNNAHNPWNNGGGRGRRGGGMGNEPPDLDDLIRKGQESLQRLMPSGLNGNVLIILGVLVVGIWAATGVYRVGPAERGVELVFGKFNEITNPGLHFNYPAPIGEVYLPSVDMQRRLNVGFSNAENGRTTKSVSDNPEESIMLTSDENIVDLDFTVFWRIGDPRKYLFAVRDPENTIKVVAESAMREVVGQTTFDLVVTRGREEIETRTLEVIQRILDAYDSGVIVERVELQASDPPREVIDAFNDVQRARQDRDRLKNEADAYANSIVPQARGEAERTLREAEAYKDRLVEEAKGEALRFLSVYETYKADPDVTRQRMYLETMGAVYRNSNKILIDPSIAAEGGQGVVPYLPLNELQKNRAPAGASSGNAVSNQVKVN